MVTSRAGSLQWFFHIFFFVKTLEKTDPFFNNVLICYATRIRVKSNFYHITIKPRPVQGYYFCYPYQDIYGDPCPYPCPWLGLLFKPTLTLMYIRSKLQIILIFLETLQQLSKIHSNCFKRRASNFNIEGSNINKI